MKLSYKTKNNKKAFTLIELLIVIAIIGILFIVLVSRVDFATDKAKATGVQTDFRSFQVALDQVAKENAGFNIFGWDTGDTNGDHIRNSYDQGDANKNGKEDAGETFTGRKTYGEDWTTIYTMLNPKVGMENDDSAFVALEAAINANLDPKLHITITPDVEGGNLTGNATITMANQARDPWKNEYHGVFITSAARDNGADRGAIILYSDGANGKWGSAHDITNGVVSVTVPNNNKHGQDDYSITSCYTYTNGYGEVLNMTTGFSSNQNFLSNGGSTNTSVGGGTGNNGGNLNTPIETSELVFGQRYQFKNSFNVEEVFSVAIQSSNIEIYNEGEAECTMYIDTNHTLFISGYDPSQKADTYVVGLITYDPDTGNEDTLVYVSAGYIAETIMNVPELAPMLNGPGWYGIDASTQEISSINAPSIIFDEAGSLYVDDLNILLPLFAGATSTPTQPLAGYNIIDGNNSVFVDSVDDGLVFRSNADYNKFKELKINGVVISRDKYTVSEGSTIITLSKEFCESLPDDTYTIEIHATDGYAKGTFEIDRSIKIANNTGVKNNVKLAVYGDVWYEADTEAKTLYEFILLAQASNSRIWSVADYSMADADNSFYYLDENGLIRNFNDVPIEANTTYYIDPISMDSYYWELLMRNSGANDEASLLKYGSYKTVYVEISNERETFICHKSSTYKNVVNATFPFWYSFCDPSVLSKYNGSDCFKDTYGNSVVIYYPGTESFGTLNGYLAEVLLKNGVIVKFDDPITHCDTVVLYTVSGEVSEFPTNSDFYNYIVELYNQQ